MTWVKFELPYDDVTVKHASHNATGVPALSQQ